MSKDRRNIVGLEGEEVSFETDVLSEERKNAAKNYAHLKAEAKQILESSPYPDIKPSTKTWLPGDLTDLQYKKSVMQAYWDRIDKVKEYSSCEELYSGHIRFLAGGERYFMESPWLKTKEWDEDGHRVILINVDDKNYKQEVDGWHYPASNPRIAFSRNIEMARREVLSVDTILDRSDSLYGNITDNYLRNALKRNKDKSEIRSIIQTIQRKQDDIRSLPKHNSFIVQGCAGSGKTMVLLHRLRYLIYNKDIYSEDYYFLVPSTGFKRYVRDITAKFNISYNNIFSYQKYYRYLLGKTEDSTADETSELVFGSDYLSRVYSRDFIQESCSELFEMVSNQANALIEYCDEQLNDLITTEQKHIAKNILSIKQTAYSQIQTKLEPIAQHLLPAVTYDEVPAQLEALSRILEQQRELVKSQKFDVTDIVISPDDERIRQDEKLAQLNSEIDAEELRVKKASLFTVNSHRKKLQVLVQNRDSYYEVLMARVVEDEKRIRTAEAAKLSVVFDGLTIMDIEAMYENTHSAFVASQQMLEDELHKQETVMDIFAEKYSAEISALNSLIEASAEFDGKAGIYSEALIPIFGVVNGYTHFGQDLYGSFVKHIAVKKDREDFQKNFRILAQRTENEQKAYLTVLLFNICRRKIKDEFKIKVCDKYKHFWYLSLYCNYLIYGDTRKHRPYIFIDEGQDLSPTEIELIQKLNSYVDSQNNTIPPVYNIFGDVNQTITKHGVQSWNELVQPCDIYLLDENFRNTNQIVDYCNENLPFKMKKIGVDMKPVKSFVTVLGAREHIRQNTEATFIVKDEYAAEDLKLELQKYGIENCTILTVKDAKGLEFKSVFVVERDMSDNEKYISYTRALAELNVIHLLPVLTDHSQSRIIQGDEVESA